MEMKNPVRPGLLVNECFNDLGLSVAEAAKGLGVTRQQLHNVIAGRSRVTSEMAIRFERAFGSTADTWLRIQVNYALAQMRKRAVRSLSRDWFRGLPERSGRPCRLRLVVSS